MEIEQKSAVVCDESLDADIQMVATAVLPLIRRRFDFSDSFSDVQTEHVVYYLACYIHSRALTRGDIFPSVDAVCVDRVRAWGLEQNALSKLLSRITYIMERIWSTLDDCDTTLISSLDNPTTTALFARTLDPESDALFEAIGTNISIDNRRRWIERIQEAVHSSALQEVTADPTTLTHLREWFYRLLTCWMHPAGFFSQLCRAARNVELAYPPASVLVFPVRFWHSMEVNVLGIARVVRRNASLATLETNARHLLRIPSEFGFQPLDLLKDVMRASTSMRLSLAETPATARLGIPVSNAQWLPRCVHHLVRNAGALKHKARRALAWFAATIRPGVPVEIIQREFYTILTQLYGTFTRPQYKGEILRLMKTYQGKGSRPNDDVLEYSTRCSTMVANARDEFRRFIGNVSNDRIAYSSDVADGTASAIPFTPDVVSIEDIFQDSSHSIGIAAPICPIAFEMMVEEVKVVMNRDDSAPFFDISGIYSRYGLDLTAQAMKKCTHALESRTRIDTREKASPASFWLQYARQQTSQ